MRWNRTREETGAATSSVNFGPLSSSNPTVHSTRTLHEVWPETASRLVLYHPTQWATLIAPCQSMIVGLHLCAGQIFAIAAGH